MGLWCFLCLILCFSYGRVLLFFGCLLFFFYVGVLVCKLGLCLGWGLVVFFVECVWCFVFFFGYLLCFLGGDFSVV